MKKIFESIYFAGSLLVASAVIQSCSMEAPFESKEGVLKMKLSINSDLTRAFVEDSELDANCVVYISNDKGLVFKKKGLSNIPEQITLRQGRYLAEAWTGDSVPASFDKKFYYGQESFDVTAGVTEEVELTCKIANVVASVNKNSIDDTQVKNLTVTVSTSKGSLEFTDENFDQKGYFMMPFDADQKRESVLNIKVHGENILGEPFDKKRIIENAKPGYEYVVKLSYDDTGDEPNGGGYITMTIDEREVLVASTHEIFAAPSIEGVDFDIEKQIIGEEGKFVGDKQVKIVAFDEITSFTIECVDATNLNLPAQAIDLKHCDDATVASLHAAGITWDKTIQDVEDNKDGHKRQLSYITFSEQYLNNLPERNTEYRIILTATDGTGHDGVPGKTTSKTLRIAVGENAIVYEDPLVVEDAIDPNNHMAIGARRATLRASIKDETASGLGIQYREVGATTWTKASASNTDTRAGQTISVELTNLKPGTDYEYKAFADGFEASDQNAKRFTTEAIFIIPNSSMEDWSTYSASTLLGTKSVILPGGTGDKNTSFWGSGNEGSATANKTVLDKSGDIFHSGKYSARLASTSAAGVIAAGNIFVGSYVKTDGTNGVLSVGREYNSTHPSKVKLYANYRPGGSVKVKSGNEDFVGSLVSGGTDQGQIYIALTTEPIEIRTNPKNRNLFPSGPKKEDGKTNHPDYSKVVAYGQVTWDKAFGPDGSLEAIEIPFEYTENAQSLKPKYLVIVASASKYGDFFSGSESSVMYLDDFELVYE